MMLKDEDFFVWNGDVAIIKNDLVAWENEGRILVMRLNGGVINEAFRRPITKLELKLRGTDKKRFLDQLLGKIYGNK